MTLLLSQKKILLHEPPGQGQDWNIGTYLGGEEELP